MKFKKGDRVIFSKKYYDEHQDRSGLYGEVVEWMKHNSPMTIEKLVNGSYVVREQSGTWSEWCFERYIEPVKLDEGLFEL
jgi:hypothetical protein